MRWVSRVVLGGHPLRQKVKVTEAYCAFPLRAPAGHLHRRVGKAAGGGPVRSFSEESRKARGPLASGGVVVVSVKAVKGAAVMPTDGAHRASESVDGLDKLVSHGHAARRRRLAILLPALNEEKGIGATIDGIPVNTLKAMGYETDVWVVDGHSTDRTLEIAQSKGAKFLEQRGGKGKGIGVRQAFHEVKADFLVMLDADSTYPSETIPDLVKALENGSDVVIGSRMRGTIEDGAMSTTNRIGNKILSLMASALYGQRVSDVCTGMWAFDKKALDALKLNSNHFEIEAELFAQARKKGLAVTEIPIDYRRRAGETKLAGVKTGLKIGAKLLRKRVVH